MYFWGAGIISLIKIAMISILQRTLVYILYPNSPIIDTIHSHSSSLSSPSLHVHAFMLVLTLSVSVYFCLPLSPSFPPPHPHLHLWLISSSSAFFNLEHFPSHFLSFMTLVFLNNINLIFNRMFFILCRSHVLSWLESGYAFLAKIMHRWCCVRHHIWRHTYLSAPHWWCWFWSLGQGII